MSKAQVLDKGIRQKSTKRVNLFIAFCPGPPNQDPRDSEKWWRVHPSITMMARHAMRGVLTSLPANTHKNRNACIDWSAAPTKICGVIRHPMQTGQGANSWFLLRYGVTFWQDSAAIGQHRKHSFNSISGIFNYGTKHCGFHECKKPVLTQKCHSCGRWRLRACSNPLPTACVPNAPKKIHL